MAEAFQKVDYGVFRKTIRLMAGSKVKNKPRATYLYDINNNILAILKSASLQPGGGKTPTEYFIRR